MSTYAIGDIQGCLEPLEALLEKIDYDTSIDQLWFAGDLVNRGPDSLRSLRLISKLPNTIVVLGNHDMHLLALKLGDNAYKKEHSLFPILEADDSDQLIEWLRQRPLIHHDPHLGYTMSHAGILPSWSIATAIELAAEVTTMLRSSKVNDFLQNMYGNEPSAWSDQLTGWERLRFITNAFTRMRFCDTAGNLVMETKGGPSQNSDLIPWYQFESVRKREDRLIFGHWAALNGKTDTPNIFALDTGCVWGGHLTALRLEDQKRFCVECTKP